MKNPLKKTDSSGLWVASIFITALAAGALTCLYVKKGRAEEADAHLNYPYVRDKGGKKKKAKTDLHDLHTIIPAAHEDQQ
jgi:hypothetical protein